MVATQLFRNSDQAEAFAAGQVVFSAGDAGTHLYVVVEGQVDILVNGTVVETIGPGGLFGEMALIEHKPRSATAVVKSAGKLVPVDEKRFTFLVQQTPFFALQLMKVMADRLRRTDQRL